MHHNWHPTQQPSTAGILLGARKAVKSDEFCDWNCVYMQYPICLHSRYCRTSPLWSRQFMSALVRGWNFIQTSYVPAGTLTHCSFSTVQFSHASSLPSRFREAAARNQYGGTMSNYFPELTGLGCCMLLYVAMTFVETGLGHPYSAKHWVAQSESPRQRAKHMAPFLNVKLEKKWEENTSPFYRELTRKP